MPLLRRKKKKSSAGGKGGSIPSPEKKKKVYSGPSTLKRIVLSISHFGLGKFRGPFIQNMSMMLGAGLHVTDALEALTREASKGPMKKLIRAIHRDVENGMALWRAMDQRSFFTPYTIALVRIGEESGNLAENMANLAKQDEKDHAMKQKVKMAMIYPSIVIVLTIVIGIGLSWFVLPQLVGVLFALNVELPVTTLAVIAVADFFTENGPTVVPLTIIILAFISFLVKFTPLKIMAQWFLLMVPGIKTLIKQASIARFGIILGSLMKAGVAPVTALQSLTDVTTLYRFKKFYGKLTEHIQLGDSFSKSFTTIRGSKKVLPVSVQSIIVTGEQSGRLSDVLEKIADIYQIKAEETAQKLPIILEPMLLIVIAALVAFIAFSIIMPIYSVVGNIGGQ